MGLLPHRGDWDTSQEKSLKDKRMVQKTKPLTFHRSGLFVPRVLKLALKKKDRSGDKFSLRVLAAIDYVLETKAAASSSKAKTRVKC